ncbi:MAG: hypothetical protein U0T83_01495 [Bacteriovoracaceae bacterium]
MQTEKPKKDGKTKVDEHIFRGAYNYFQNDVNYCTETFNVYRGVTTYTYTFKAEILSRMENGEFLKIVVEYVLDTSYSPLDVSITRYLGNQIIKEVFAVNQKENKLRYSFEHNGEISKQEIDVPAKFQIATPAICTSALSYLSKKYDPTTLNRYVLLVSPNDFKYVGEVIKKNIFMRAKGNIGDEIIVTDKKLKASAFYMYESDDIDKSEEIPICLYLSKHISIPYLIESGNNTKIEVKYFNKLKTKRFEDLYQEESDEEV